MNGHDVAMPDRRALLKGAGAIVIAIASPFGLPPTLRTCPPMRRASPATSSTPFAPSVQTARSRPSTADVDLGTGVRTALGQIVAEELDVPFDQAQQNLGDTETAHQTRAPTPSRAPRSSRSLRSRSGGSRPSARDPPLQWTSTDLGLPIAVLVAENGVVRNRDDAQRRLSYGARIANQRFERPLSTEAPLKAPRDYKVVGAPVPRVDIPAKVTGGLVYVHDMRVPGMLHPGWSCRPTPVSIPALRSVGA